MKRKIKIGTILLLVAMTGLLTGCGHKVKNEAALQEDLMSSDIFSMPEGSSIAELSVIKRLTDKKNKQDTVWVAVEIDHEAAQAEQAYVMNYTDYNDGWRVDSIEQYYGDEVSWEVTPKTVPTQEEIMDDLIEYSNTQIMQNCSISGGGDRFFEEGKYVATFYPGEWSSDVNYACCIEIGRSFEWIEVWEAHVVSYVFDTTTFKWLLIEDEIVDGGSSSYISGTWSDGNGIGAQITYNSESSGYDMVFSADGVYANVSFILDSEPSTHEMYITRCSFTDYAEREWTLDIYPWEIICYSEDGESITLKNESAETEHALEDTGILDGSGGEKAEPYIAAGKEFLDCIWNQKDMTAAMEMTYLDWSGRDESDESVRVSLQSCYSEALFDSSSSAYEMVMALPAYIELLESDDPEWEEMAGEESLEELKKRGKSPDGFCLCGYLLKTEWDDGTSEYIERYVWVVKEQEEMFIYGYSDRIG